VRRPLTQVSRSGERALKRWAKAGLNVFWTDVVDQCFLGPLGLTDGGDRVPIA
jgi:hypothetical protein